MKLAGLIWLNSSAKGTPTKICTRWLVWWFCAMFYFKGCGKCKGDLHLESDAYGKFLKCLQCGRITEVDSRKPGLIKAGPSRAKKLAA